MQKCAQGRRPPAACPQQPCGHLRQCLGGALLDPDFDTGTEAGVGGIELGDAAAVAAGDLDQPCDGVDLGRGADGKERVLSLRDGERALESGV
ncbi:MAG: hypothetical protein GWN84_17960 [Gammaproteobacteria bacterium]|nr:hypothetical protein [Gammaproteobacteria bacterium]NIR82539.1 hypothetical protein [Gammaproteobacteria bacterium]NIR88365.1 hypothetical protein [Gammaproteobacteria bacterium]NIU03677.1 hypothetical protein [Gammaproteobacteria bacterium]NIV52891.1 hypothetical protein [Gammaproteobacteria bacterium]